MYGYSNGARIRRVQYIRSFEQAQLRYDSIKPIRGRADTTIRPLIPDRSAADTYSIRKRNNVDGSEVSYECWLYNTPVLIYNHDGNITINMDSWNSATTRTFITEVLGFNCSYKNGSAYLTMPFGVVVLPKVGPTVIRQNAEGVWELVLSARLSEVQLKRKEANNVRAQYKPFIDYVDTMLKLRSEYKEIYYTNVMSVRYSEFEEALGEDPDWNLNWRVLGDKEAPTANATFIRLISDDQDGSFYKAFLFLIASLHGVQNSGKYAPTFNVIANRLKELLKKVLYKIHSNEVFERVELPVGKIPSKKYESWV